MAFSRGLLLTLVLLAASLMLLGCAGTPPVSQGVDSQGNYYRGSPTAKVTIYEYSDFECPNCKLAEPEVTRFISQYESKGVRIVYKQFPLESIHPDARNAAVAALCAGQQGKFWEYHDLLFEKQPVLDDASLVNYAAQLKLDTVQFAACEKDPQVQSRVDAEEAEGLALGIQGTPTFIAGDITLRGTQTADRLGQAADHMLAQQSGQ